MQSRPGHWHLGIDWRFAAALKHERLWRKAGAKWKFCPCGIDIPHASNASTGSIVSCNGRQGRCCVSWTSLSRLHQPTSLRGAPSRTIGACINTKSFSASTCFMSGSYTIHVRLIRSPLRTRFLGSPASGSISCLTILLYRILFRDDQNNYRADQRADSLPRILYSARAYPGCNMIPPPLSTAATLCNTPPLLSSNTFRNPFKLNSFGKRDERTSSAHRHGVCIAATR
jgi:hypothetical protein